MELLGQFLGPMALSLLITCLAEGAVTLLFRPRRRWLAAGVLGNLATNPLLNGCLLLCSLGGGKGLYYGVLTVGELCAVGLEYYIYRRITDGSTRRCLGCALLANACSLTLGFIL